MVLDPRFRGGDDGDEFFNGLLAQLLPGGRVSAAVLAFGALATVAAVSVGLAIIPEEAK